MPYQPAASVPIFHEWLASERTVNGRYAHHLLTEKPEVRPAGIAALQEAIERANEDVRRRLRLVHVNSLDPFGAVGDDVVDPARGYPAFLDYITLKGYFGEVMAGLLALTYGSHGINAWEIPVFLFRCHEAAFQYLERQQQAYPDGAPDVGEIDEQARMPGRTGDDCLAFQRDDHGQIIRVLCCEAKCADEHSSGQVPDAHTKASEAALKPVDLRLLIEALDDHDEPEARAWQQALMHLKMRAVLPPGYERCDLVCYVYGKASIRTRSRIPMDAPHPKYVANRRLEAVEVCLPNVRDVILAVYRS
jgi:hypothetical protein